MRTISRRKQKLEINQSVVDIYTIGHSIFGGVAALVYYLIINLIPSYNNVVVFFIGIIIALLLAVGWEFLEYYVLSKTLYKQKNKEWSESSINAVIDVFVMVITFTIVSAFLFAF